MTWKSIRPARIRGSSDSAIRDSSAVSHSRTRTASCLSEHIHSTVLFRIKRTQALGGSGSVVSKRLETNERISKYGSTAFAICLAVRCGGPGMSRFSSAFPTRLSHKPPSSKCRWTCFANVVRSSSESTVWKQPRSNAKPKGAPSTWLLRMSSTTKVHGA